MNLDDSFEDGLRGLALGVFVACSIVAIAVCCFVGAWTVARWLWSLT